MTKATYLEDTYLYEMPATLVSVQHDERGPYGLFDATLFHPQGGGQPSDVGVFAFEKGTVSVTHCVKVDGETRHYGDFANLAAPVSGIQRIDSAKRMTFAKCHTAGHLIGSVVEALYPALKGVKGYHFLDSPYVEFAGVLPDDSAAVIAKCNAEIRRHLDLGLSIETDNSSERRLVTLLGFPQTPCGGTHLRTLKDLREVLVTKIKAKAGNFRFSYRFD